MLIDMHTHAYADAIAEKALRVLSGNSHIPPVLDGKASTLSESTRRAGLDYSVMLSIATKPTQTRTINTWALSVAGEYSNIIPFGTIHPDNENFEEELSWLAANGFRGVKIHPDYQKALVNDPRYMDIFAVMEQKGLILITHAGFDVGLPPPRHCMPHMLAEALDAFPRLTVIAAHMGGVEEQEEVRKYYNGRNVYLDTCFTHLYLSGEELTEAIKRHGAEKVLFGTDSPHTDQRQQMEYILSLKLSDEEKALIMGGNAARLLKL
ncbi:MAG: amidohydrolase [Abditibacteriota bacterium]|nr:amidohydrolase [Abditibacteriota bacterium]